MGRGGLEVHRGKIRVHFRLNGKRYREPLGLPPTPANLTYAKRLVAQIVARIEAGTFDYAGQFPASPRARGHKAPDQSFNQVADRWLATLEIAPSTLRSYRSALRSFWRPALGDRPIRSIKPSDVKTALAQRFRSGKTRNNYLIVGRGVFEFALDDELITRDPSAGIRNVKVQTPEPDPLTIEEVDAVLEAMRRRYPPEIADYFEFAFFTGLRPSEQIALTWADVDLRSRTVTVRQARVVAEVKAATKSYRVRRVELNTRAGAALMRQEARSRLAGREVWLNPQTARHWASDSRQRRLYWHPTLRLLGMRQRDAYQTRHTYATLNLMAGANPAWIARQMGHKDAQMLWQRYGRWIPDADAGRERAKLDALIGPRVAPG